MRRSSLWVCSIAADSSQRSDWACADMQQGRFMLCGQAADQGAGHVNSNISCMPESSTVNMCVGPTVEVNLHNS